MAVRPEDLTGEAAEAATVLKPRLEKYDPAKQREWTRTLLAGLVVGTVPIVILVASAAWLLHLATAAEVKDVAVALIGTVAGLAGAVLGFYFGEKKRTDGT
jgi:hypothetical protein